MAYGKIAQDKVHCHSCGKKECDSCSNALQTTEEKNVPFCSECGRDSENPCSVCRSNHWLQKKYEMHPYSLNDSFIVMLLHFHVVFTMLMFLMVFGMSSALSSVFFLIQVMYLILICLIVTCKMNPSHQRIRLYYPPTGEYLGVDIMVQTQKDRKLYTSTEGLDNLRVCLMDYEKHVLTREIGTRRAREQTRRAQETLDGIFPGLAEIAEEKQDVFDPEPPIKRQKMSRRSLTPFERHSERMFTAKTGRVLTPYGRAEKRRLTNEKVLTSHERYREQMFANKKTGKGLDDGTDQKISQKTAVPPTKVTDPEFTLNENMDEKRSRKILTPLMEGTEGEPTLNEDIRKVIDENMGLWLGADTNDFYTNLTSSEKDTLVGLITEVCLETSLKLLGGESEDEQKSMAESVMVSMREKYTVLKNRVSDSHIEDNKSETS